MRTREIIIPADSYVDEDDCLHAAARDYALDHDLAYWQIDARWGDDATRETIVLTVPV